jgi:hypothetical protein
VSQQRQQIYGSRAADLIDRLILFQEEEHPLPEDPSAGMLVARVTERLAQAGFALDQWHRNSRSPKKRREGLLKIGVFFLGAATLALDAIPPIQHEGSLPPTMLKDMLLDDLDDDVLQKMEEEDSPYYNASEDEWHRVIFAFLVGALQGVAELEGMAPLVGSIGEEQEVEEVEDQDEDESEDDRDDEDDDPDDDEERTEDDIRSDIAQSLIHTAVVAALAGQWFIERHEELEEEQRRRREPPRRGRRSTQAAARGRSAGSS